MLLDGEYVCREQTDGNIVALTVDAESGYLFWANNERRSIYRARLDGTQVETIVSEGKISHAVKKGAPGGELLEKWRHMVISTT